MKEKITKKTPPYPKGYEPNYIVPSEYHEYRFALGKRESSTLVAICMNPSAAKETTSDTTINRIINVSRTLGMAGWMVFNVYPERATYANKMDTFNQDLSDDNMKEIEKYLVDNNISEVWGAWGDDKKIEALVRGKQQLLAMLSRIGVKVFYFGTLTKNGNPRHPIQRQEKWDFSMKKYLDI